MDMSWIITHGHYINQAILSVKVVGKKLIKELLRTRTKGFIIAKKCNLVKAIITISVQLFIKLKFFC